MKKTECHISTLPAFKLFVKIILKKSLSFREIFNLISNFESFPAVIFFTIYKYG